MQQNIYRRKDLSAAEVASALTVMTIAFALSTFLLMKSVGSCFDVKVPGYSADQALDGTVREVSLYVLIIALGCSMGLSPIFGAVVACLKNRFIQQEIKESKVKAEPLVRLVIFLTFALSILLPLSFLVLQFGNKYFLLFVVYLSVLFWFEWFYKEGIGKFVIYYFATSLFCTLISTSYTKDYAKKLIFEPIAYVHESDCIEINKSGEISLLGDQGVLISKKGKYSLHGSYGEIVLARVNKEGKFVDEDDIVIKRTNFCASLKSADASSRSQKKHD